MKPFQRQGLRQIYRLPVFFIVFWYAITSTCIMPVSAAENTFDANLAEQSGAQDLTNTLSWDIQSVLDQLGLDLSNPASIGDNFTMSSVWEVFSNYLTEQASRPFRMLAAIVMVIFFAALLQSIHVRCQNDPVMQVFEYICTLAGVAVLADPLCQCFETVSQTLTQGAEFMLAFVPVFSAILAAGGTAGSAICYQTAVIALSDGIIQLISHVLLPLCTMSFALAIVDAASPSVSVSGLLTLSKKVTTWTLGLLMSIFLGVLSMQNWISGSVDTAATRTTKYVISNFVPVVGGAVSDAYTTVRGSLQILRSATGVVGIVALCLLFLPPLIELLCYRFIVAIGAALAELFGTKRLLRLLRGTEQALAIAFALLICFGIMFVVSTAIALTIGKGTIS